MLDCLTAGLELEVVGVKGVDAGVTVGVALRLAARLELEVVGVTGVDAGFASTAGVALQEQQCTNHKHYCCNNHNSFFCVHSFQP